VGGILTGKFVGVESIIADLRLYSDTIRARVREAVEVSASELVTRAKSYAPVLKKPHPDRTGGELRSSIRWSGAATERRTLAKIGTDVFYGRFQESGWTPNPKRGSKKPTKGAAYFGKGWKRNPKNEAGWADYLAKNGKRTIWARPFLKPALNDLRGTIRQRLLDAVEKPL
jgi:hypothetical protein